MRMLCLAKRGASARSIAWMSALVSVAARLKKTDETRSRASPARSMASMVLANVGAALAAAIAAISLRLTAKPRSKAGTKWSIAMRSNGGISNGVVHASNSGFTAFAGALPFIAVAGLDFRFTAGFLFAIADAFSHAPGRVLMGSVGGFVEMLPEAAHEAQRGVIPAWALNLCSAPRRQECEVAHV